MKSVVQLITEKNVRCVALQCIAASKIHSKEFQASVTRDHCDVYEWFLFIMLSINAESQGRQGRM